jgi:hypothetical protein
MKPATEIVRLADGAHAQALVPGVAPVSLAIWLVVVAACLRLVKVGGPS